MVTGCIDRRRRDDKNETEAMSVLKDQPQGLTNHNEAAPPLFEVFTRRKYLITTSDSMQWDNQGNTRKE